LIVGFAALGLLRHLHVLGISQVSTLDCWFCCAGLALTLGTQVALGGIGKEKLGVA